MTVEIVNKFLSYWNLFLRFPEVTDNIGLIITHMVKFIESIYFQEVEMAFHTDKFVLLVEGSRIQGVKGSRGSEAGL